MRVLLDTDVVLDLFLERPGFVDDSMILWEANERGKIDAFISSITLINLFYFARKAKGREAARQMVLKLLASVGICRVDRRILQTALSLPLTDYEDAVQLACAESGRIEAIITRNLRDYRDSTLPVYSPPDFIALMGLN
jgi:predicted nucleic acid-binding protein